MAKVDIVRIAYKGSGPAVNDMISGQCHMMFPTTSAGLPHVKTGRLRALGVTTPQPSPLAPGLPTVAESLPGYESVVIYAFFAPASTPAPVIKRLNQELVQMRQSGASTEKLLSAGIEYVASTPAELATEMKGEMTRLGKLIKDAGIRVQ
jgi:tripartite-type tricarboxylate transporter receptor subunit TctC